MKFSSIFRVSLVSIGNVLNSLLGMVFFVVVANKLSVEDFGRYALLISILVAVSKITDFGTNSTYITNVIKYKAQLTKQDFLNAKILLFFTALVVGTIVLHFTGLLNFSLYGIFVIGLVGYTINTTLFAYFQRHQRFLKVVGINTVPAAFKALAGILALINVINLSVYSAFAIFSLAIYLSTVFLINENLNLQKLAFFSIKAGLTGKLLIKESANAGISQVITSSWAMIANTMAKLFRTFTDVGVFNVADKIANVFMLISLSVFTVLLPQNAIAKKENKSYSLKETGIFAFGIIILAIIAILLSRLFLTDIFGDKFESSVELLGILIFASAFTAIHMFIENFFYIEEQTQKLAIIIVFKTLVFIVLGVILIPRFSLMGLGISQLISAIIGLGLIVVTTFKSFNFK